MDWLLETFLKSEELKEVVYLISHIPVGDNYFSNECAKRFQAILNRFDHIIKGQFYGHSHQDEIKIVHNYFNYDEISGVQFIAPSMTT